MSIFFMFGHDLQKIHQQATTPFKRIVQAFKMEGGLMNQPEDIDRKTNSNDERIMAATRRDLKLTAKAIRNDLRLMAST